MDDSSQIEPPASFIALFTSPTGARLLQPASTVRERYELCEDLAQMLTDRASAALHAADASQRDVLERMRLTLSAEDSPLQAAEAAWVVRRLAELLDWNDAD